MNDYGFTPGLLFNLTIEPGVKPNFTDIYTPNDEPFKGNSAAASLLGSKWPLWPSQTT
jgi:hypothetical protein